MSDIALDLDMDRLHDTGCLNITNNVHLQEREDEATIQKVMELEIPELPVSSSSLEGRVSLPIEDVLNHVDPELLEEAFNADPDLGSNYILRLQELVAAILAQYQQISEKDKLKIDQLEREYKVTTLSVADLTRELGWSGLKFAAVTFAASFLQFVPGANDADRVVAKIFAEQVCPQFGNVWNSDLNAKLTSGNNLSQMLMNKYNLLANAEQSKANDKQQVSGVFEKALRNQESASRNG